jgi:hypothetical protein
MIPELKGKLAKFWPKAPQAREAADDESLYIYNSEPATSTVLVTLIGVQPHLLEEIILNTQRRLSRSHRLIYLTDQIDFSVFRKNGAIFEYVPALLEQRLHASAMPWHSYMRSHWGLLLAKWRPRQILTYGLSMDRFLAAAPKRSGREFSRTP